jgi:hypothetical protein
MSMPLNVGSSAPIDSTTTAQETVATQNAPVPPAEGGVSKEDKKRHQAFKGRIDACKSYKRKLIPNWTQSIDMRRGKPFASQPDEDTIAVNLDWSMTKSKVAALFSQIPKIRLSHPPQTLQAGPWVTAYEAKINDILVESGIEAAMDESLPDCVNAAGIGASLVSYEAITEDKEVPAIDMATLPPEMQASVLSSGMFEGQQMPMETVPSVVDRRYLVQRLSPADLLWPVNFTSANFDNAPWLGRSGRVTWSQGVQQWKLKEEDKAKIVGEERQVQDKLTNDIEKDKAGCDEMVSFDELFYKEFHYDEMAKSYSTIHHMVYVNGIETPVVDESWKGQKVGEDGKIVGAIKLPIRILTLTYVTDETIPPSDSAIGRPQVNEINKSRTQMIRQRERSIPVRWFDVNRVDPTIQQGLMKGTWQNMIPVQGEGTRVIGEVARATMSQENFAFDKIAKADLNEAWTVGPNQQGSGQGVDTASEAEVIQSNFQTKVGRERAKVAAYFVGIAEVLGGLIALYEDPAAFGEGFDPGICRSLSFSILADSTVLVDATQRLKRLDDFMNKYGQSGWVDLESVLKEIATLVGLDANVSIKAPEPKPPVEPNISLRLTGAEDMMNPLMLAFMLKSGQAPPPELIEKAKQLIQQAVVTPQTAMGAMPVTPPGPPIEPPVPGQDMEVPPPAPPPVGQAHPNLAAMPTIDKRSEPGQS